MAKGKSFLDNIEYVFSPCIILFGYLRHSLSPMSLTQLLNVSEWMSAIEKGKSCVFSSCQKYLHQGKVTAGMSRLFPHPTSLCVRDSSLNWVKQPWVCWQIWQGFFFIWLLADSAGFIGQSRNDDCGWRWHWSAHENWRMRVSDLIINLPFIKPPRHSLKSFTWAFCLFTWSSHYRGNSCNPPIGGPSDPLPLQVWPLSWFSFITRILIYFNPTTLRIYLGKITRKQWTLLWRAVMFFNL